MIKKRAALLIILCNLVAASLEGLSFSSLLLGLSSLEKTEFHFAFLHVPSSFHFFLYASLAAVIFQVIRSGFCYLGQILTTKMGTEIQTNLQQRVYGKLFGLSYADISSYKIGDLAEYAKAPVTMVMPLLDAINRSLISFLMILASLIFMAFISLPLTALILLLFAIAAFSQKFVLRLIGEASSKQTEKVVSLSKETLQALHGLKTVYIFHKQGSVLKSINRNLVGLKTATMTLHRWQHLITPYNEISGVLLAGFALLIGSSLLKTSPFPLVPTLLTFLALSYRLGGRLLVFMEGIGKISGYHGERERLKAILNQKEPHLGSSLPFPGFEREIAFKNVFFTYPGKQDPSLRNVTFTIPKGKTIAIVGHTGSGKSTILDLLVGLYYPSEGEIQIDQVPLSSYDVGSWRKKLGVVSQDVSLFHDTIGNNISFGDPTASFERIQAASKLAGADRFISLLAEGYHTIVGEKGYRLSGGEKQTVCLARALLLNPEILLLDEATSHLDSISERMIQDALLQLKGHKTLVIVAHRLSTIQTADIIYVFDKGELIEQGSHEALLAQSGKYSSYWENLLGKA